VAAAVLAPIRWPELARGWRLAFIAKGLSQADAQGALMAIASHEARAEPRMSALDLNCCSCCLARCGEGELEDDADVDGDDLAWNTGAPRSQVGRRRLH
jgi:hypothetical protein